MLLGCETPSPLPLASAPGAGLCTLDKDTWVGTWAKVRKVSHTQRCKAALAPGWGTPSRVWPCTAHEPCLSWGWGCHQVVMLRCCIMRFTWRELERA